MRKIMSTLGFFLICTTFLAQDLSDKKIIKNQLKDFKVFKTSLFELEANLYDHISKDSLSYYLDNLESICSDKVIDNKTLYKEYSKVLVKIQSGHTNLQPTQKTFSHWIYERNSLPMDVIIVGKKLYTASDYSLLKEEQMKKLSGPAKKENTIKKYTEIISIDGDKIPNLMNKISPYLSSDYNDLSFKHYLVKDLFEFYRNLSNTSNKTSIDIEVVQKKDTVSKTIKLGYPPIKEINERYTKGKKDIRKQKKDRKFGTFEMVGNKYGYFRFYNFEKSKGKKYRKFLKESFEKMEKKDIKKLVIDVRDNTGGFVQYDLLTYLFPQKSVDTLGQFIIKKKEKPSYKRYIVKDKHWRRFKKAKRKSKKFKRKTATDYDEIVLFEQLGRQKIFEGDIIVITNEGTFSAASMLAADLKNIYGAKIIGSQAGGSFFKGATGNISVELPYSKFKVTFNPIFYKSSVSTYSPSLAIPDVEFIPEFKDPKKDKKKNEKNILKIIKTEFKKK